MINVPYTSHCVHRENGADAFYAENHLYLHFLDLSDSFWIKRGRAHVIISKIEVLRFETP